MSKVIYTKYSNDRSDAYRILTKIIEDNNGKRVVIKEPLSEKAQTHIDNIARYYMELSEEYEGQLKINQCEKRGKIVEFEYLQGETLEEQFIHLYHHQKFDELNVLFDEFVKRIENGASDDFIVTDDFIQVFGDVTIDRQLNSLKVTDIDMVLSNIIITNNEWNLIDYEWTYDFPIPIRFVLYRSIKGFLFTIGNHKDIDKINFYQRLSMDETEIAQYEKMEKHFQQYVTNKYFDLNSLYSTMGKKVIPVWEAVEADNLRISLDYQVKREKEYQKEIEKVVKDKEEIEQDRAKIIQDMQEIEQDRARIIQECTTTIVEKDNCISELEHKLTLIQNSRVWKLRNKIAKLCGRE